MGLPTRIRELKTKIIYKTQYHVQGRGIHNEKIWKSLIQENLKDFIKNDESCDMQIRNNYLNIYYRGSNLVKIKGLNSFEFDKYYFKLNNTAKKNLTLEQEAEITQKGEKIRQLFKEKKYDAFITEGKKAIDNWLKIHPKKEREEQHQLAIYNHYGKSNYTIIDIEYQVSTKSSFSCSYIPRNKEMAKRPRFDIIALNTEGRICIFELKKGSKALNGDAGIIEHLKCYNASIKRDTKPFIQEMSLIVSQKKDLGVINKKLHLDTSLKPKFMFLYAYDKSDKKRQEKKWKDSYQALLKDCKEEVKTLYLSTNNDYPDYRILDKNTL